MARKKGEKPDAAVEGPGSVPPRKVRKAELQQGPLTGFEAMLVESNNREPPPSSPSLLLYTLEPLIENLRDFPQTGQEPPPDFGRVAVTLSYALEIQRLLADRSAFPGATYTSASGVQRVLTKILSQWRIQLPEGSLKLALPNEDDPRGRWCVPMVDIHALERLAAGLKRQLSPRAIPKRGRPLLDPDRNDQIIKLHLEKKKAATIANSLRKEYDDITINFVNSVIRAFKERGGQK